MLVEHDGIKEIDRLKRRSDFLYARNSGMKWVSLSVIVQLANPPQNNQQIRYGITATKKLGNAVIRNRTKRRLRSAACEVLPQYGQSGFDYVLIGRDTTRQCPYEQLVKDLRWCVKRLHKQMNEKTKAAG